jgi:chromosome segregation protein
MRLKSLELVGFKSFFDPTLIVFSPGITAVVGPNGCGKSNVMDAIRWVLGEQAPTRLRGKSIEDLIYAGNEHHPAAGMAEVSLTLEAEEHRVLPEPYDKLSEICVTRRAYRSGDSEYLINKIPCRLKDITEFFMAAGIHSRGYALIEQGRVEEIIQAKPAEIRALIEEAAGLGLFKGRREMSERKLERVRENLSRVSDVLAEIERQLNYSRRQAKKAETYRVIRGELNELERLAAARRLFHESSELTRFSERESELRAEAQNVRVESVECESQARAAAEDLAAERERLNAAVREFDNLRASDADRARAREFLVRRLAAVNEEQPALSGRLAELEAKAIASRASRAHYGARLARELRADDGSEAALEELKYRHEQARAELRGVERRGEELKDELSELVREAAVIRGRLADLSGERAELDERLSDHAHGDFAGAAPAIADFAAALSDAQRDLGAAESNVETARAGLLEIERQRAEATDREIEWRSAMERAAARLAAAREALKGAERREARRRQDPVATRLRGVLESLNGDRPASDPPPLLEVLKAPAALEPALRGVMGEQLEAVVVDSPYFAVKAIDILKEQQAGRLSFVPEAVPGTRGETIDAPGIAGRLVDMLEVEPRFAATAEALLGHVMLADNVSAALNAANLNGHGTVFVTRDGDLVHPGRIISGGSVGDPALAESDTESTLSIDEARAALDEATRIHADAERELADRRAERTRCENELGEARRAGAAHERAFDEARQVLARIENQAALAEARRADAVRRLGEIAETVGTSNLRLEELAIAEQQSRAALAALREELSTGKAAVEALEQVLGETGARVEARRATLKALEQELRHLRALTAELEAQSAADQAAHARLAIEKIEFEGELEKLAVQDAQNRQREVELGSEIARLRETVDACEGVVGHRRARLEQTREQLARLEQEAVECGLHKERASALSEELQRSFAEKFLAPFATLAEQLEADLAARNAAEDEQRITELRARAERIGEVNLAAESEVQELEERAATLNTEKADLEAAVEDLTQTIGRLNREARRRFAETFEGAARHFSDLFPKLMRGGQGHLELDGSGDLLEAGVNILIQPPGKKVRELALLSGGEKALSAMALMFSLFMLNPSPFCVMDEVDAPLDEFSIAAFATIVQEFKERSQFIVITHNQRTMQRADQVHGVTMDRPGISKVISMRIANAAA